MLVPTWRVVKWDHQHLWAWDPRVHSCLNVTAASRVSVSLHKVLCLPSEPEKTHRWLGLRKRVLVGSGEVPWCL